MRRVIPCLVFMISIAMVPAGAFAQSMDLWTGTWTLNIARSTYSPGPPPEAPTSNTTVLEMVNGVMRISTDSVNAQGARTQTVRYAHFDGGEHGRISTNSNAANVTYVYSWIDERTYQWVSKADGQELATIRLVLSPDGMTQTLTVTGTNAQGHPIDNEVVFEKQ